MITKDTRFKQGGAYFSPLKVVSRESFAQFYSEVIIEMNMPLNPLEPVLVGDSRFFVRDIRRSEQGCTIVLMPEVWAKSARMSAYKGSITPNSLLGFYGIKTLGGTSMQYMTLATTTLRQAMGYVKGYGLSGGKGIFSTIDSNGIFKILCPQTILEKSDGSKPYELAGQPLEMKYSLEWVHMAPGLVNLAFYSENGIEEEIFKITPSKHPVPTVTFDYSCFIDDPAQKEVIRAKFRNAYWYNYFTSQYIKLAGSVALEIGQKVKYAKETYLIWETELSFTGGSVNCNMVLVKGP
jgi:hypothetical protein